MTVEYLREQVATLHWGLDSEILDHANNYYLTASTIYDALDEHPYALYPLLTLLGLSAELFLKAFSADVTEFASDPANAKGSILKKTVKSSNRNSHDLGKLFNHYATHDKDLYDYLTLRYSHDTERILEDDLIAYSKVFESARYIFEYDERDRRKYSNDVSVFFYLVRSLSNSVMALFKDY